ncbi:MAG TPA: CPBP family intramembrane glutamic endopeptidase [Erysipelotrichaceae bacterium]|nr:CPBP family intramembrane glutamic endopeptidase [Erysipelotrichaceae bacterium]
MNRLLKKNAILHAIAWIGIYIGCVNVFDIMSESVGVLNLITSLGLSGLSILLVLYLKKQNKLDELGLKHVNKLDYKKMLYFIPLVILAISQFTGKLNTSIELNQIVIFGLLMINVGFIEEVIFRGLLFKAIKDKSGFVRAILISGITFGLGHIVNLMRGMAVENQVEQIILAIVIGILLALIVEITQSLIPGIIFHILFNFSSTIMVFETKSEFYLLISILVISIGYSLYLYQTQLSKSLNLVISK